MAGVHIAEGPRTHSHDYTYMFPVRRGLGLEGIVWIFLYYYRRFGGPARACMVYYNFTHGRAALHEAAGL